MSTFLELCQQTANRSGTLSGTAPTTVEGQTGRLGKVVGWVQDAWRDIQNAEASWQWMRLEWSGALAINTAKYLPASFTLTDHAAWITEEGTLYLYDPDIGVADEHPLEYVAWTVWNHHYGRGAQTANRPVCWTVTPKGEIAFGPKPDKAYPVRGEYRQSAVELTENADVPAMPARFHDAIRYKALMALHEHDEAWNSMATAERSYRVLYSQLQRDQLPRLAITSDPIA